MEFAKDPTFESIFTSTKVTNIFESLSKDENILETELYFFLNTNFIYTVVHFKAILWLL